VDEAAQRKLLSRIRRLVRSGEPAPVLEARGLAQARGGAVLEEYRYRLREQLDRQLRSRNHETVLSGARLMKALDPDLGGWMLDRAEREVTARLHTRTDHVVDRGLELLAAFDHPSLIETLWAGAGLSGVLDTLPWRLNDVRPNRRPDVFAAVLAQLPEPARQSITTLRVSRMFSGIHGGPDFPPEAITALTGLRVLDVEKCTTAEIPAWIGQLSALTELIADQTDITDLPETVPAGLEVLSLQRCAKLTALPTVVGRLHSLKRLDLSDSGLATLPADLLAGLTALEELDLSRCRSLEAIPTVLAELPSLRVLDLRGCAGLTELPLAVERRPGLQVDTTGCTGLPRPLARLRSAMLSGVPDVSGMSTAELRKVAAEIRPLLNSAQAAEMKLGVYHLRRLDDDALYAEMHDALVSTIRKRTASDRRAAEGHWMLQALDRPALHAAFAEEE